MARLQERMDCACLGKHDCRGTAPCMQGTATLQAAPPLSPTAWHAYREATPWPVAAGAAPHQHIAAPVLCAQRSSDDILLLETECLPARGLPKALAGPQRTPLLADQLRLAQHVGLQPAQDGEQELLGQLPLNRGQVCLLGSWGSHGEASQHVCHLCSSACDASSCITDSRFSEV